MKVIVSRGAVRGGDVKSGVSGEDSEKKSRTRVVVGRNFLKYTLSGGEEMEGSVERDDSEYSANLLGVLGLTLPRIVVVSGGDSKAGVAGDAGNSSIQPQKNISILAPRKSMVLGQELRNTDHTQEMKAEKMWQSLRIGKRLGIRLVFGRGLGFCTAR